MEIKLTKEQAMNVLAFLNRLEYKGLKEAMVVNQLFRDISEQINKEGEGNDEK